ncbi:hypothetical protein [Sphingobium sp.]|uniref:hypothetical protein n=1 Tax=Sphingobium sp. TaxID=1912891 RepID=UPI00261660D5|nr:hypothetical protein [Sphingobium sp.]
MIEAVRPGMTLGEKAINGGVAAEYVNALISAVELALGSIRQDDLDARRMGIIEKVPPLSEAENWETMCSLLNIMRAQVAVCIDLFQKIELDRGHGA